MIERFSVYLFLNLFKIKGLVIRSCTLALACVIFLQGCISSVVNKKIKKEPLFTEVNDIIPFENRSRRKWDNAVVADLDKDGFQDILLTEHGHRVLLFWNNQGVFSGPIDIAKGDTHGVAVGDYNRDGRINIIISLGGGGGNKPRSPVAFEVTTNREIEALGMFDYFEKGRGRSAKLIDADNNGSLDLLLSAYPLDSQKKQGANHLYKNEGGDSFDFISHLPFAKWLGYRVVVTDFDSDGVGDLIFYGGANMVALRGSEGLSYQNVSENIFGNLVDTSNVSSITEIDYDNDGDFDLFFTRKSPPFYRELFFDQEGSRFAFFVRNEEFQFEDMEIRGDFRLENLQMAYPHYDVFIGANKRKFKRVVDRHGGTNITLPQEDALGWPKQMKDKGLYIGYLGNNFWRVAGATQSPTAGVIHNVVTKLKPPKIDHKPALLFENREGVFVDVTKSLGISVSEQTASAVSADFNNDGWSDLFVLVHGNPAKMNEQIILINDKGKSFKKLDNHGVISKELGATGGSAETVDYDNDGDVDLIYSNERGRWHLFKNNSTTISNNNYILFEILSSPSGKATALGASLNFKACNQVYRRVVGSTSAPYSQGYNNHLHVGLGQCKQLDDISVRWTNGETVNVSVEAVNKRVVVGNKKL